MPREEDEFRLSYYNSMTTWIDIDALLKAFGLTRADVLEGEDQKITAAIRSVALRLPTYVTLKEVKKRWGHGRKTSSPSPSSRSSGATSPHSPNSIPGSSSCRACGGNS
jgi:hypothetical protein